MYGKCTESVLNLKTQKYSRLGGNSAFVIIRDHLPRNDEWKRRVKYMSKQNDGVWANKMKSIL